MYISELLCFHWFPFVAWLLVPSLCIFSSSCFINTCFLITFKALSSDHWHCGKFQSPLSIHLKKNRRVFLKKWASVAALGTTPCHPMSNGLVEKFNGTLKQIQLKWFQVKPKAWDRYLTPLLFAYREAPQSSTGFSPFEIIYGRNMRRPPTIFQDFWTGEKIDEESKTTCRYLLDLHERI